MKGCCCGCEFKKSCRGLLDKLWLYYTHYHLFVVLNIAIVTTCVVMPILKTNFEYRYGRLPCDPVFTPLILSGRKYGNLQKFKVRLSFGDHLLELLMFGAYYLSAALSFIAHVFRNKTSCVLVKKKTHTLS